MAAPGGARAPPSAVTTLVEAAVRGAVLGGAPRRTVATAARSAVSASLFAQRAEAPVLPPRDAAAGAVPPDVPPGPRPCRAGAAAADASARALKRRRRRMRRGDGGCRRMRRKAKASGDAGAMEVEAETVDAAAAESDAAGAAAAEGGDIVDDEVPAAPAVAAGEPSEARVLAEARARALAGFSDATDPAEVQEAVAAAVAAAAWGPGGLLRALGRWGVPALQAWVARCPVIEAWAWVLYNVAGAPLFHQKRVAGQLALTDDVIIVAPDDMVYAERLLAARDGPPLLPLKGRALVGAAAGPGGDAAALAAAGLPPAAVGAAGPPPPAALPPGPLDVDAFPFGSVVQVGPISGIVLASRAGRRGVVTLGAGVSAMAFILEDWRRADFSAKWRGSDPRTSARIAGSSGPRSWLTPLSAAWFVAGLLREGGPIQHRENWKARKRLSTSDYGVAEHHTLSTVLEDLATIGEVNVSSLVGTERLLRKMQLIEHFWATGAFYSFLPAAHRWLKAPTHPNAPLFPITPAQAGTFFEQAAADVGVATLAPQLRQLRHAGPSVELAMKLRTLASVKLRGGWRAGASVARYLKLGRVSEQLQGLGPAVQRAALLVFSGEGVLAAAPRREGPLVIELDVAWGPDWDLTVPKVARLLRGWLGAGPIWGMHFWVPCQTWTRIRTLDLFAHQVVDGHPRRSAPSRPVPRRCPARARRSMASLDERALETALAGLREELRGGLDRLERLLREELRPPERLPERLPEQLPASPGGRRGSSSSGTQSGPSEKTCAAAGPWTESKISDWAGRGGRGRARRRNRDVPEPEPELPEPRLASWRLIHRHETAFDTVIGLIIVLNSLMLGVEIQCDLDGNAACTQRAHDLEHIFLSIFTVELVIRVLADGWNNFRSRWFLFDLSLVMMGVFSTWVVHPIVENTSDDAPGRLLLDIVSKVLVMRILRLTRLVRALRIFEQFQEMWKLANGLLRSFRTVMSACIMILLTVFVFACLGVELIFQDSSLMGDPVTAEVIQDHFRSLPVAMFTLVQFATADSIASVYMPIVTKAWYMGVYFGFVWLIVTIKLMNLITAVIVDNAITQADEDREMDLVLRRGELRLLEPTVKRVFERLNKTPGTKSLSLEDFRSELEKIMQAPVLRDLDLPPELRKVLASGQIVDVCSYLDADRSGEIDEDEFVDGIFNLMLQSVPVETTQMLQMLRSQGKSMKDIEKKIGMLAHTMRHKTHREDAR
ncbi:unnamed protein product [Prorocentrum cordatum]|uniref:EF-hand domain-containing protein n=1 Tax=Prorocentrum cordatum TaxID=2364126 RepID=A0ABN9VRK4_9DINO|nr:unnamed protein product [Polarella glacialis]